MPKIVLDISSNKKYCQSCAKEVKLEQNKIADKKYKEKIKCEKATNS